MAVAIANNYVRRYVPAHPKANSQGYVYEHILVVEQALGHMLGDSVEVHHVSGVRSDNRNCNLVVCQDHAYHGLLHQRLRAYRACGNADWRSCVFCKEYAPTDEMDARRSTGRVNCYHHKRCLSEYRKAA